VIISISFFSKQDETKETKLKKLKNKNKVIAMNCVISLRLEVSQYKAFYRHK